MQKRHAKRDIYFRTFTGLLAVYLLLMAGFSMFLLARTKDVEGLEFHRRALQLYHSLERELQERRNSEDGTLDVTKFRRDLAIHSHSLTYGGWELAVYTGDYEPVYHTNDYWVCEFEEFVVGTTKYPGYAYLNPEDWFSEKEITELEGYLTKSPRWGELKPKQVGDLAGYSVKLDGFWLNGEMIIPDKIVVTPCYAVSFDAEGNVRGSVAKEEEQIVYAANAKPPAGLPYFERGSINNYIFQYKKQLNKEKQALLRRLVLDREKLKKHIEQLELNQVLSEKLNPLTYRYYMVIPYEYGVTVLADDSIYSDFWTVIAGEVNLWDKGRGTLLFVWVTCFIIFLLVAYVLSRQTYLTYRKMEELELHRREMTNALAHDLKTPLSIISGYAQNLLANVHEEKKEYYAAQILNKVDQMDHIIRVMLDLAKLEAAAPSPAYRPVALHELCREIMARYEDICREKNIHVHLEGEQILQADQDLLRRVIDNFFTNALQHTPEGGAIRLKISEHSFEICNTGSPIPEDMLQKIWQPYYKADAARTHTKSTGLGLAIAARILQAHGFSYGVKNTDNGVTFWFKFR